MIRTQTLEAPQSLGYSIGIARPELRVLLVQLLFRDPARTISRPRPEIYRSQGIGVGPDFSSFQRSRPD